MKIKHEKMIQDIRGLHERERKVLERALKEVQKELKISRADQPGSPISPFKMGNSLTKSVNDLIVLAEEIMIFLAITHHSATRPNLHHGVM